jgi:hypothetical protein
MDVLVWALVVVALVAIAAAAWFFLQKRRTEQLREGFGPEYDRTVEEVGDRRRAESELDARRKRIAALDIRPLTPDERARFADAWQATQARFVDDPDAAIGDADQLVGEVMQTRGYPVGEFEQRAADVSVDHPEVVSNYRAAHRIALDRERGGAGTEDLRQAMVHYRALFDELLETDQVQPTVTHGGTVDQRERKEARQ